MRLNAKTAKELRAAAQYRNQTATPSKPVFPGIARLYTMPVYMRRESTFTTYEKREGRMVRVLHRARSMHVVGMVGREQIVPLEMERYTHPATLKDADGNETPNPKAGKVDMRPKLEMVPVTKPVAATGEKKLYRSLKRLHGQRLLVPGAIDLAGIKAEIEADLAKRTKEAA